MFTVSYETGTAPASLVVVQGKGRALNPPKRSGRPMNTNLSAHTYDSNYARHNNGMKVNVERTDAFDTPVKVFRKNTGWMTVAGGKESLTITYAPDAVVKYAEVVLKDGSVARISNISLSDYLDTYC